MKLLLLDDGVESSLVDLARARSEGYEHPLRFDGLCCGGEQVTATSIYHAISARLRIKSICTTQSVQQIGPVVLCDIYDRESTQLAIVLAEPDAALRPAAEGDNAYLPKEGLLNQAYAYTSESGSHDDRITSLEVTQASNSHKGGGKSSSNNLGCHVHRNAHHASRLFCVQEDLVLPASRVLAQVAVYECHQTTDRIHVLVARF
mmetsp:Transcript_2679/g.3534  ORF Transcript_2679/g.3534 Transcript_2679/m.3534 type:complete len:204 (-) Transcript_2679:188-799(-)